MAALCFTLRSEPKQRLDLSPLVPERLAKLSQAEIERLPLGTTRTLALVGDVFRVAMGEADAVRIEGGSSRFDGVGEAMASGAIVLEGDAGLRAGRQMRGGRLEVRGNAGHWAASGMQGGEIEIAGDCGDFLGGPLAGEVEGMAGGTAVVRGNAGGRAGDRLRRGVIVVEGQAGDLVASRLIAGTVVVCGGAGAMPGSLMRRGTCCSGAWSRRFCLLSCPFARRRAACSRHCSRGRWRRSARPPRRSPERRQGVSAVTWRAWAKERSSLAG